MLRRALVVPTIFAALCLATPGGANDRHPCSNIVFVGQDAVHLEGAERDLVCGQPETPGWERIPLNQAQAFLSSFLERRAYLNPRFEIRGSTLAIDTGPQTRVSGMTVLGMPPGMTIRKQRRITGQLLTPRRLDALTAMLTAQMENAGYACPQVDLSADAATGEVVAKIQPGLAYAFDRVERPRLPGVDPRVFARYDAFERGQRFDRRLLSLTSERVIAEPLFLSADFDVSCSSAGMTAVEHVSQGRPHSIRIAAGADTEGYVIAVLRWKHSRIGRRASDSQVTLRTSYLQQQAEGLMRLYVEPDERLFLMPHAVFGRRNEKHYEAIIANAGVEPSTSRDFQEGRLQLRAGPVFNYLRMLRGVGPTEDKWLSLDATADWETHLFEYYAGDPREGWRATLEASSRVQGAYSDLTAHTVRLATERLWNLGGFAPPVLVLGSRSWAASTFVNRGDGAQLLSPERRYFVGGDEDLRGADRQQVPSDNIGFLTAAYAGVELRLGDVLPYGLGPFLFADGAMAGRREAHLDPDVYWSPGAGLRWASPLGSVRGTVARGLIWHRDQTAPPLFDSRWQLFFSIGREF